VFIDNVNAESKCYKCDSEYVWTESEKDNCSLVEDVTTKETCKNKNSDTINYNDICSNKNVYEAVRVLGYVMMVIKWLVPLALIIVGMVSFFKASIDADDKSLSKSVQSFVLKMIAGIIVFLVPTIIFAILNVIDINYDNNGNFARCTKCIFNVTSDDCINNANK